MKSYERIFTDQPIRHMWNRFEILTSESGAEKFLKEKFDRSQYNLTPELLKKKAKGITFSLRSAKEYFNVPIEANITSATLSFYYGTFSFLKALMIANKNDITLETIEESTKRGHGMKSKISEEGTFPNNELIYVLERGFLSTFLTDQGYDLAQIAIKNSKSEDKFTDEDYSKLISFKELISRIPEMMILFDQVVSECPNYLKINFSGSANSQYETIRIALDDNSTFLTIDKIKEIIELDNMDCIRFENEWGQDVYKVTGSRNEFIFNHIYRSVLTHDTYVKPILGITDVLIFNFMLLYTLSIWVRYRPALWREITDGELDSYRALIVNFLISAERVIPNIILNRLYERNILFAGHSYLG